MNREFRKYANKVIMHIDCDIETAMRIKEDVLELLLQRSESQECQDPYQLMGDPLEVAKEFGENISSPKKKKIIYKSSWNIFGLPLLSVCFNGNSIAKGVIAIGNKAIGVVSIGKISIGIVSFGALSIGVFAFGGLALALSTAFGGLAIAYDVAVGGMAIANSLAIGGVALASKVAIGGVVSAKLMGYMQGKISPMGVDKNIINSFKLSEGVKGFRESFDSMFPNYGRIKTSIIHMMFK